MHDKRQSDTPSAGALLATDAALAPQSRIVEMSVTTKGTKADLPLDKAVTVTFTPKRTGEIRYSCGMGMVGGVLDVR